MASLLAVLRVLSYSLVTACRKNGLLDHGKFFESVLRQHQKTDRGPTVAGSAHATKSPVIPIRGANRAMSPHVVATRKAHRIMAPHIVGSRGDRQQGRLARMVPDRPTPHVSFFNGFPLMTFLSWFPKPQGSPFRTDQKITSHSRQFPNSQPANPTWHRPCNTKRPNGKTET